MTSDPILSNAVLRGQRSASGPWFCLADADVFNAMDLTGPELASVAEAVANGDYPAAFAAWGDYWTHRAETRYAVDAECYAESIRRHAPHLSELMIRRAEEPFRDDFRFAVYKVKRGGRLYQWADATPETEYIGWHYFFWVQPLGRAWLLTGDERYAELFREIVCSWWDALPDMAALDGFDRTVLNSGLGSSLRCTALMDGYALMRTSPAFTPELHEKILKMFLGHTRYLYDTKIQEYAWHNGLPTAANWAITAGVMLPEFQDADAWKVRGVERFREIIARTFNEDGAHLEQCPQYHLANMRDLVRGLNLLHVNGHDDLRSDAALWRTLERVFDYPIRIAHPTGHLSVFNSGVYCTEWQCFPPLGARLFQSPLHVWATKRFIEPGFLPVAKGVSEYISFMDGAWYDAWERARKAAAPPPAFTSELLADSGVAVLRSGWERDAACMVFDFNRDPHGGHPHAGRLSFDLSAHGRMLAVNPGSTPSYSMPVYNDWCVQTASHNTVVVNGCSQKGRPLAHRGEGGFKARRLAWEVRSDAVFVAAEHDLFRDNCGVAYQRAIAFVDGRYFFVFDRLTGGEAGMPVSWRLHSPLALSLWPDGAIATPAGQPGLLILPDSDTLASEAALETGYSAVPQQYHGDYQSGDAWRDDVPFVRLDRAIDAVLGGQRFGVLLAPFPCHPPDVSALCLSADCLDTHSVRIEWSDHVDCLTVDWRGPSPKFALTRA